MNPKISPIYQPTSRIVLFIILTLSLGSLGIMIPSQTILESNVLYVDASATGVNNGLSWVDAFNDLQSALAVVLSGDEIWVAAGMYKPGNNRELSFQLKNGVAIYGGFPVGGSDFGNRDYLANPTILSGDIGTLLNNLDNSYHVVTAVNIGETAILDGFTITGGNATGTDPYHKGGGIYINNGSPVLKNVRIEKNEALHGGGIYSIGNPYLENVAFIENATFATGQGGGFFNDGGNPTIRDFIFLRNSADGFFGRGGGLISNGNLTLINGVFQENYATGDIPAYGRKSGGGGMCSMGGSPLLINIRFIQNYTSLYGTGLNGGGGGLFIAGGDLTIMNGLFYENEASSANTSLANGGGIYAIDAGLVKLYNTSIVRNHADNSGHAISNTSNIDIWNSIIWSDDGHNNNELLVGSYSVNYSIFEGGYPGIGNINNNPKFVDMSSGNLRLQYSSPAIDAGNNTVIPLDTWDLDNDGITNERIPVDLAGNGRYFDMPVQPNVGVGSFPLVDFGAYEVFNSAPILDNSGEISLPGLLEDEIENNGSRVSDVITMGAGGDPISDPDNGALEGIVIVSVDNTNGDWQYSSDSGINWQNFGSVSDLSAVVLADEANNRVRFVPQANYYGQISSGLTFRAWDQSDGFTNGTRDVYIFTTGGASPYSTQTQIVGIEVTAVNDPPTLDIIYDQALDQDSGGQVITLTGITTGAVNETQVITITASSDNPTLIPNPQVNYISPNSEGALVFESAPKRFGQATITVTVKDDGVTENGGYNTISRTFLIIVRPFEVLFFPIIYNASGSE